MVIQILIGILALLLVLVIMGPRVTAPHPPNEKGCSKPPTAPSPPIAPTFPSEDIGFNPISGYRIAVKPGMGNRSAVKTQPLPVTMPITFKMPSSSLPEFNDGAVSMTPYARLSEIVGYAPSVLPTPPSAALTPTSVAPMPPSTLPTPLADTPSS